MLQQEWVDPLKACLPETITKPKLEFRIDWQLQAEGQCFLGIQATLASDAQARHILPPSI